MLMMMGTPSGNEVKAPDVATVFIEDQEGGAAMIEYLPPGLENISNTCYMNATIQCLGASKELRSALVKSPLPLNQSPCLATHLTVSVDQESRVRRGRYTPEPSAYGAGLTAELAKLYEQISSTGDTQQPMAFWSKLRADFPQFNEQVRPGAFAQQDADDCWGSVVNSMTQALVRSSCCPLRQRETERDRERQREMRLNPSPYSVEGLVGGSACVNCSAGFVGSWRAGPRVTLLG